MKYELLTGATGLLGSYLMRDALRAGRKVAVLARGTRWMSARERIETILERLETDQMPVILEGNLHEPGLGLNPEARAWVAENCASMLHCAAALQFMADANGEPYRTNVDGTRFSLGLCAETGIREFHLVSTAYISGSRRGEIRETDFERDQIFSNDYERSKYLSEHLVREARHLDHWTIYRPSVIVGDFQTGFTSSYTGVYSLLRLAWLFSGVDGTGVLSTLGLGSGDGLNLVSVDWVSAALRHLVGARKHAETYHLTSRHPVSARRLYEAAARALTRPPQVPPSALDEAIALYRPYLGEHPSFDSSHTERDAPDLPCPELDDEALDRLVRFASDRGFELPPEWNFRARMEALRKEDLARDDAVLLEVNGPEGGIWSLAPGATGVAVARGEVETDARAFCNPATLEDLVTRKLNLEGAVYSGLLLLEGPPARMEASLGLLESFLAELREARVGR